MAALLGGVPLAFGTGIGSELRRPLGIAMVGGLLLSQVLTLYTTPVIYIFFDNLAQRDSRAASRRSARDAATSRSRQAQRMNISASIYPPAGRDDAADDRDRDRGCASPSPCCRFRRCRRWIFRPSPFAPACRAPARRSWPPRSPRRWSGSSATSPASPR